MRTNKQNQKLRYVLLAGLFVLFGVTPLYASPITIKNEIEEELEKLSFDGAYEISSNVRGTTVEIDGFVSSPNDRAKVEELVKSIEGVKTVDNRLTIRALSDSPASRSSSELVQIIRNKIKQDPTIMNYSMDVSESGSVITLRGTVQSDRDKKLIEDIARQTAPLAKVQNALLVKGAKKVSDADINQRVIDSLRAEGLTYVDKLNISTEDGIVYFRGNVSNHREIDKVLSTTLMVDGVRSVRSDVVVASR